MIRLRYWPNTYVYLRYLLERHLALKNTKVGGGVHGLLVPSVRGNAVTLFGTESDGTLVTRLAFH